jgi:hypothetical protein
VDTGVAGGVHVEVSMNNQQYSMSEVSFEYQGMASVTSLEPVKGPSEGGTFVVVRGSGFSQRSSSLQYMYCMFNTTRGVASYVSEVEVHCVAPEGMIGYVSLEMSNNDLDYTESGVQFEYEDVMVSSVHPSLGLMSGGTEVMVLGEHFHMPGSKGLWC